MSKLPPWLSIDAILRTVAAAMIMIAGVVHLLVTGVHSEIPLYWVFFIALGSCQLAAGLLLLVATARRFINLGILSMVVTASSVLLYAVSRTSLFPSLIEREPIEPIGLFTKIVECAFLILTSLLLFRSSKDIYQNRLSRRTVAHLASLTVLAVLVGQASFVALGSPLVRSSFYGLNLGTKWSYDAGAVSVISTPPILANGILYFGTLQAANPQYSLVALNSSTGSTVWQRITNDLCTCSPPAVYDDTLYMVMVDTNSPQESLYTFNARSGLPEWNFTTEGGGYYLEKLQTPQIWEGAVFALLEGDHLYAVNSTSGKMLWEYGHGEQGLAPFAVDRGLILLGSRYQNYFQALNATDGATVWRVETDSQFLGQALVSGGLAYAVSARGIIYAFDEVTGSEIWRYSSGVGADEPPVIHDGVVYVRGMSGHSTNGNGSSRGRTITESSITVLDARNGELIWSSHDNGLGMSKVATAEGIVYSGAAYGDGSLYMYDADHGWFAGVIPMKESVAWPPAVGNGTLFLATNQGKVYALETRAPNALLT